MEIVVAAFVMAVLTVPLFSLLSSQWQELEGASREALLHGYAIDRLAEEESRLVVSGFGSEHKRASKEIDLRGQGGSLSGRETVSIQPTASTTALWKVTIDIEWKEFGPQARQGVLSVSSLVVRREHCLRLPLVEPTSEQVEGGMAP